MRVYKWLPAVILGLLATSPFISAEQIRLADGRFIQGDVVEIKEDGFVFKLTETGGQVYLRWNQVDDGLKKRLTNDLDPDEGLNFEVMIEGSRLELIDGSILEGDIKQSTRGYIVKNFDLPKGKEIPADEVLEDGYVTGIMIDASIMMVESDVLKLAEEQRDPIETARQYYELARIADKLGMYPEAKDYVTLALASNPDSKLQARLTDYDTQLDELIRQAAVLQLMVEARKQAKKKVFQAALDILDEAKTNYQPTGAVLTKVDDTYAEIDLDFTKFVITEWYKAMKGVARDWLKEKENKEAAVTAGMNYARRQMDIDIQEKLMEEVGGTDPTDIRNRFNTRFDLDDAGLVRLTMKKVSFGEDGFYQIVGGHLPLAGKKPTDDDANSTSGGPGGGRRGPNSGRDRDGIDDPNDGFNFQDAEKKGEGIPLPDGISPDDVNDILRKILGKEGEKDGDSKNDAPKIGRQDISKLKVPEYVPSLTEWWEKCSTTTKAKWLVAVYVKSAGTMRVFELDDWDIKFK